MHATMRGSMFRSALHVPDLIGSSSWASSWKIAILSLLLASCVRTAEFDSNESQAIEVLVETGSIRASLHDAIPDQINMCNLSRSDASNITPRDYAKLELACGSMQIGDYNSTAAINFAIVYNNFGPTTPNPRTEVLSAFLYHVAEFSDTLPTSHKVLARPMVVGFLCVQDSQTDQRTIICTRPNLHAGSSYATTEVAAAIFDCNNKDGELDPENQISDLLAIASSLSDQVHHCSSEAIWGSASTWVEILRTSKMQH